MWSHVGLQDPVIRLSEGRVPLRRLPVTRVRQRPISALRSTIENDGWRRGRDLEGGAAWRSVDGGAEVRATVARGGMENLRQERATERTPSEKEIATEDGKGAAGDLTGYLSTGEERQTHEDYRDWVHSNNGDQISGGISNNNDL